MSTRLTRLFSRTPGQRRWRRGLMVAGVILVPLAVAGVVTGGLANADERVDTIPALIVNNDEMVTQTAADGSTQNILAGRLLVTQLTHPDSTGFGWKLSSTAEAKKALKEGTADAVLTIPKDFSASISSISSSSPSQADLRIQTDDAHSYLAGSLAQSVGDAMSAAFGRAITEQYLSGFYANLAGMGTSLSSAADGATQVSSGVSGLATGLDQLATGAASAASGASQAADGAAALSTGVDRYTDGVDSLASGVGALNQQASGLTALSEGTSTYVGKVGEAAAGYDQLSSALTGALGNLPGTEPLVEQVQAFGTGLDQLAAGGSTLAQQTGSAVSGLQGGIGQLASGASALSSGSDALRSGTANLSSGVGDLATGLGTLSSGVAASASGAHQLAGGASSLATGLTTGAGAASALGDIDADKTAKVVSDPVAVTSQRENPINSIGAVIGMIFVPVGLWIGALAVFLLLRPLSRLALQSTASTPRLVTRVFARSAAIGLVQAVLVVALLHTTLGVAWNLLPATLSFAALCALVFAAVHQFLTTAFGRVGIVISLLLVVLQLTSAGGIYPVQILAEPYQLLSPFLPLGWAVQGMQQIVSGAGGGGVAGAAAALIIFGALGYLGSLFAVSRRRGARSWGYAAAAG
ncbi:YhgE/Pip family protein [Rathayibacter sp. YIM 133350]|uniref:YhgE/Pip domain-containing protein n=1 Tax=Rathayibacter sp. YIM 133350 TaxID=3131992 RepID=UPI00307CDDCA